MKPQASPPKPTPPQFQHGGIDLRRALLILGLPLVVVAGGVIVLVGSPTLWWIAAGVAAAGVTGGVVLRRSRRARSAARRLPGVGRAGAGLRRMTNGRFARSPLGRAVGRAIRRSPAGSPSSGRPAGRASRPQGVGGRLRAMLPPWAGGTRKTRPAGRPGGAGGQSAGSHPGGRARAMLSRLMLGGRRRPTGAGGPAGRPSGRPGSTGAGGRPKSRAARAWSRVTRPFRPSGRLGGKPGSEPSPAGSRRKPGTRPSKPGSKPNTTSPVSLTTVREGATKTGRLIGRGLSALLGPFRRDHSKKRDEDDFDLDGTYEIGIEGEVIDGKHVDPELGAIARRVQKEAATQAAKLAKKRIKEARKAAKAAPEWPNIDVDEVPLPPVQGPQQWPDYDVDDYAPKSERPPKRSLPTERDHDPPSRIVSPPPHREAPRITSTNTTGGTMQAADTYVQMIDNSTPSTYATTCREAAEQARRDSTEKEEEAKKLRREADDFDALPGVGNKAAAQKLRGEAANCEQDARNRLTWASRLDGMANDADAKIAS